jgi:hypothetical protein
MELPKIDVDVVTITRPYFCFAITGQAARVM